jgi:hypothetical protein
MKKIITHAMMILICITSSVVFTMDKDTSGIDSESDSPVATPRRKGTPFGSPLLSPQQSPRSSRRKNTPLTHVVAIAQLQHHAKEEKKDKAPKTSEHHSLIEKFEAQVKEKKYKLKNNFQEKTHDIEKILDLLKSDEDEPILQVTATHADGSPVAGTTITPITTPPATPRVHISALTSHSSATTIPNLRSDLRTEKTTDEVKDALKSTENNIPQLIPVIEKTQDTFKENTTNAQVASNTSSWQQKNPSSLKIIGVSVSLIALIALLYRLDLLPANIIQALDTYLPQFLVKNVNSKA